MQPSACNYIIKETPAQLFFCEFFEIIRIFFFVKHLQPDGSAALRSEQIHTSIVDFEQVNTSWKCETRNDPFVVFCSKYWYRISLISAPALIKFWNCEVQRLLKGGAN